VNESTSVAVSAPSSALIGLASSGLVKRMLDCGSEFMKSMCKLTFISVSASPSLHKPATKLGLVQVAAGVV
jgi:hypothetical protein